jgi:putative ABC transport system permease protein
VLHRAIPSVLPADFPRVADLALDVPAVLFCIAVTMATGIAFGVLPALRARRLNLVESLSEDGTAPIGASGRSGTARVRMAIIAAQVAIACVLLVGASLLARSFLALVSADRGYNPSGVLTATLSLPSDLYSPERRQALASQILERLGVMPGVTDASFTSELPLTAGGSTSAFTMRSRLAGGSSISAQASPRIVSPGYLRAAGMRVIAGRGLVDADTETSVPVVVVNRAFARRYLGDAALGAMLPMAPGYLGDDDTQATVVGVVDDVRYLTAADSSQPEMFFSYRQMKGRLPVPVITLVVRTTSDPAGLGPALRSTIRSADEGLVPEVVMTMEERMMRGLARPRLYAVLLAAFAAFALIVAAVGLVGVLSYTVAQRSRELAVRTALGARQADVAALVLRQGLTVTAGGIAVGVLLSLAMTRWLASLLYGVTPHDGPTYLVVPLLLALVSGAACLAPARRAARVDPLSALRQG